MEIDASDKTFWIEVDKLCARGSQAVGAFLIGCTYRTADWQAAERAILAEFGAEQTQRIFRRDRR